MEIAGTYEKGGTFKKKYSFIPLRKGSNRFERMLRGFYFRFLAVGWTTSP